MPRAFISGVNGQDGSYLAELLLDKGYKVFGLVRRRSTPNTVNLTKLLPRLKLITGDLEDAFSLIRALDTAQPDEIYNLAAQSDVTSSFTCPHSTAQMTGLGALNMLEAFKTVCPSAKYYQASSSEMFGDCPPPQNEQTPFRPRSPYAVAKVFAHHMTCLYRDAYGLFACCGTLFNHESPRRGTEFVTRKITHAAAHIKAGLQDKLYLGNTKSRRDWGYAGDYVEAMWRMLQQPQPDDYVIGTGKTYSVEDFLDRAFGILELDWRNYVETDKQLFRPAEVPALQADPTKAHEKLYWAPTHDFDELVELMVRSDVAHVAAAQLVR